MKPYSKTIHRIGEIHSTKKLGNVTIIDYKSAKDVSVMLEDGSILNGLRYGNILQGYVGKPKISRVGEKYITNEGYEVEIIEYFNPHNVTVKFNDGVIFYNRQYNTIKNGTITNPNYRFLYNKGYIGIGDFKTTVNSEVKVYYKKWHNIFFRCYDIRSNYYKNYGERGVGICEYWYNLQNFAQWFYENYNPEIMEGWHLDKDILVKGNKIYSPETCCFVPNEINVLFTNGYIKRGSQPKGVHYKKDCNKYMAQCNKYGKREYLGLFNTPEEAFQVYKETKEVYIKEVADKWKGLISDKVYEAIYNYQVEITD